MDKQFATCLCFSVILLTFRNRPGSKCTPLFVTIQSITSVVVAQDISISTNIVLSIAGICMPCLFPFINNHVCNVERTGRTLIVSDSGTAITILTSNASLTYQDPSIHHRQ